MINAMVYMSAVAAHLATIAVVITFWPAAITSWTGVAPPTLLQGYMTVMLMRVAFMSITQETMVLDALIIREMNSREFAEMIARGPKGDKLDNEGPEMQKFVIDEMHKNMPRRLNVAAVATKLTLALMVYLFGLFLL